MRYWIFIHKKIIDSTLGSGSLNLRVLKFKLLINSILLKAILDDTFFCTSYKVHANVYIFCIKFQNLSPISCTLWGMLLWISFLKLSNFNVFFICLKIDFRSYVSCPATKNLTSRSHKWLLLSIQLVWYSYVDKCVYAFLFHSSYISVVFFF